MVDFTEVFRRSKEVLIEVYKPDREFFIEGELVEGGIAENLVREADTLCIRFSWDLQDFIDIEVYSKGRCAWFRLTHNQFDKIKNYIQEVQ